MPLHEVLAVALFLVAVGFLLFVVAMELRAWLEHRKWQREQQEDAERVRQEQDEWERWKRAALSTRSTPIYLPFGYGLTYHTTLGDSGMPKRERKSMAVTFQ